MYFNPHWLTRSLRMKWYLKPWQSMKTNKTLPHCRYRTKLWIIFSASFYFSAAMSRTRIFHFSLLLIFRFSITGITENCFTQLLRVFQIVKSHSFWLRRFPSIFNKRQRQLRVWKIIFKHFFVEKVEIIYDRHCKLFIKRDH